MPPKGGAVIKVIIERRAGDGTRLLRLLRDIRVEGMKQPGYISGETLVDTEDNSTIVAISTWENLNDWKAWDASETRARLEKQIKALLVEEPKVRTYRYLSYQESKSGE